VVVGDYRSVGRGRVFVMLFLQQQQSHARRIRLFTTRRSISSCYSDHLTETPCHALFRNDSNIYAVLNILSKPSRRCLLFSFPLYTHTHTHTPLSGHHLRSCSTYDSLPLCNSARTHVSFSFFSSMFVSISSRTAIICMSFPFWVGFGTSDFLFEP